jgi:hypothetical protein
MWHIDQIADAFIPALRPAWARRTRLCPPYR